MVIRVEGSVKIIIDDDQIGALISSIIKECGADVKVQVPPPTEAQDGEPKVFESGTAEVTKGTAPKTGTAQNEATRMYYHRCKRKPNHGLTEQELKDFKDMLEETAKNAVNFEQFVGNLAQQLGMGKQAEFLKQLVFTATNFEELTWAAIEEKMGDIRSQKAMLTQKLKKNKAPTPLYLLIMIMKYQEYAFEKKQPDPSKLPAEPAEETMLSGEGATTKHVIMKCFGDADFGEINTAWTRDEKLKFLLDNMGLKEKSQQEQSEILGIATEAVTSELQNDDDVDKVIMRAKAGISADRVILPRMRLAQFIEKYAGKKVKVLTFLQELKGMM